MMRCLREFLTLTLLMIRNLCTIIRSSTNRIIRPMPLIKVVLTQLLEVMETQAKEEMLAMIIIARVRANNFSISTSKQWCLMRTVISSLSKWCKWCRWWQWCRMQERIQMGHNLFWTHSKALNQPRIVLETHPEETQLLQERKSPKFKAKIFKERRIIRNWLSRMN